MPQPPVFPRRAVLLTALALGLSGFAPVRADDAASAAPLMAYVGTYTSPLQNVRPTQVDLPPGNGRGIHRFIVDRKTGALTPAGVTEMGTSPSCLVTSKDGTRMYSANETEGMGEPEGGSVSAFAIDRKTGDLKLINSQRTGGAGPTYVSLHPSGKFLFVANYFGGSVAVFPIQADGSLGARSDLQASNGTVGPKKATSAPPGSFAISGHDQTHAHMIEPDPSGRYILSVDLGIDQILVWKFDPQTGKLSPNDPHSITFPPGDGPRHFAFHPKGRWLYSLQEEGSTVTLLDYDPETGRAKPRQTLSTLPPGYAGSNFCSEILLSSDARFVYVGNRLHDSIGIFAIGADGSLSYVGEEWTHGDYPRSFTFEPTGTFLYSCNQRADHVATFRADQQSGKLAFTGQYTPVGNPSIIIFLDLGKK